MRESLLVLGGIVRDITEERNNQKLVKEQQQQLTSIVENSDIGIVLVRNHQIVWTNTFLENYLASTENVGIHSFL